MTIQEYLRSLNILHLALLVGMVIFCVAGFVVVQEQETDEGFLQVLVIVVAIISLLSIFGGFIIFRKMVGAINETKPFAEKLHKYRSASIIKWAMIEAPVFLCIVAYIITGQISFMVAAIGLTLFFILHRPAKARIVNDLLLPPDERDKLNDGNSEI